MSGEEVVPAALFVMLRLGAHVENLSPQRYVCWRGFIPPIELLTCREYWNDSRAVVNIEHGAITIQERSMDLKRIIYGINVNFIYCTIL